MSRLLTGLIVLSCTQAPVAYDTLTLIDGEVLTGRLERDDGDVVMFRVIKLDGKITHLREIRRAHIEELTRAPSPPELPEPETGDVKPEADPETHPMSPPEELRHIFEEWEIRNVEHAARRLVKLVNRCQSTEFAALDKIAHERYGVDLADFSARVSLAYSQLNAEQGHFRLYYITSYNIDQAGKQLRQIYHATLRENVIIRDKDEGEIERVDSIDQWMENPQEYYATVRQAAHFEKHVSKTIGMNRELVRLCRTLQCELDEIQALNKQREQLRRLLGAVQRCRHHPNRIGDS